LFLVQLGCGFIETRDIVSDAADTRLRFGGVFALAFLESDFFAESFPVRLEVLELGFGSAALFVALEDGVNARMGIAASRLEAVPDEIGVFAEKTDIEHGSEIEGESG
jgi:hypothetical protein